jgi:hypothetical protein
MTPIVVCLLVCALVCLLILAALRLKGDVTAHMKVSFLSFSLDAKDKRRRALASRPLKREEDKRVECHSC